MLIREKIDWKLNLSDSLESVRVAIKYLRGSLDVHWSETKLPERGSFYDALPEAGHRGDLRRFMLGSGGDCVVEDLLQDLGWHVVHFRHIEIGWLRFLGLGLRAVLLL